MKIEEYFDKITEINKKIRLTKKECLALQTQNIENPQQITTNQIEFLKNEIRNFEKEKEFLAIKAFKEKLFEVDAKSLIKNMEIWTDKEYCLKIGKVCAYKNDKINPKVSEFLKEVKSKKVKVKLAEHNPVKYSWDKSAVSFIAEISLDRKNQLVLNVDPSEANLNDPIFRLVLTNAIKSQKSAKTATAKRPKTK